MTAGYPYNTPFEAQFSPERQQEFIIQKLIRGIHTCDLVRVLAVRPVSDRVGFVDLLPLVQDVDTADVRIVQTPIFNVPYFQYQGGPSAIILTPEPGDIGLAMFAERDISNVKTTLQEGPAATARVYSSGDGLYIGGVLNPAPTQWIRFEPAAGGITVVTPGDFTLQAGGNINLQAVSAVALQAGTTAALEAVVSSRLQVGATAFTVAPAVATSTAPLTAPEATIDGVVQSTHVHGGVTIGIANTGVPHN
jgi:hypothetical protein